MTAEPVVSTTPAAERVALRPVAAPAEISVLVVTWNSERWIERCLRSVQDAADGLRHEIVVYDNASSDATLSLVPAEVQVIRSATNAGFAAGTNRALAVSTGRYLFLLNPDCELEPLALRRLVTFLDEHPEAAAAAPLLTGEEGDSQREFQLRRLPTLRSLATEVLLLDKIAPANATTRSYRYRDLELGTEPCLIEQPAAAALLIRRSVVSELGLFDEQFTPAWFEDVDFCKRLSESGASIYVVPAAGARHFGGASLEHLPFAEFIDVWYRNMWLYARKWMSAGESEALRWFIITGMLLRCLVALVKGSDAGVSRWSAVRAYASVLASAFHRWSDGN